MQNHTLVLDNYPKAKNGVKGFTLLEFIIFLSTASIMLTIGFPSMQTLLDNNRQLTTMSAVASHLAMVRSKAIFDNKNLLLCKSSNGQHCAKSSNWNQGWITFFDSNNNKQRDDFEKIILSHGEISSNNPILYSSFGGSKNYVRFYKQGYSHTNGTFVFCNPQGIKFTKTIVISKTGRIRSENKAPKRHQKKCLPYVRT